MLQRRSYYDKKNINDDKYFLTENGIKQLKSTLENDIFHNERYKLFTLQTEVRNDIKAEVDKLLNNFAYNHYNYSYTDDGTETFQLMQTLKKELNTVKGKKVYGYLPKDIKLTVDTILDRLYFEPTVNQLFLKWNKLNNMKLSTYYDNKVNPIILLSENKEFQFLKNMIIREVDAMQISNEQYTSNDYPIPAFNLAHQVAFSLANAIEGLQNKMRAKIPKMVESKERQKDYRKDASTWHQTRNCSREKRGRTTAIWLWIIHVKHKSHTSG